MTPTTSTRLWLKGSIACALAILVLGTGRAMAVDASITAIDILLKPDATMIQRAAATNERLRKVFPNGCPRCLPPSPHKLGTAFRSHRESG